VCKKLQALRESFPRRQELAAGACAGRRGACMLRATFLCGGMTAARTSTGTQTTKSSSRKKPQKAAAATGATRPVDNRALPAIFRHLRREAARKEAPIVTLIAVTTRDPWRVLSSCILSLRTQDGTTAKAAARMFAKWPDVHAMAAAEAKDVEKAIYPVGFYRTKAPQLVEMAARIVREFSGRVPDDIDTLLTFTGVGRKTANLVVTAAYGKPGICVDTHVHRITNLWGYVETASPEATEAALRAKLPRRYWLEINDLLVSFGQTVCKPASPRCSVCPLEGRCPKIGVTRRR
jgi:endonuclease III